MNLSKYLLLFFSSVVTALLLTEGFFLYAENMQQKSNSMPRVLSRSAVRSFRGCMIAKGIVREDPVLGYYNVPEEDGYMLRVEGMSNLMVPGNFDFSVLKGLKYHSSGFRTNKEGNRGGEMVSPKPKGIFRVVFLGDSVTFGYFVEENETFVKVTESLLQGKKGKSRAEAVNAGVSGLSVGEILAHLKKRALAWEPDLVVWVFYSNDLTGSDDDVIFPARNLRALSFLGKFATGRFLERLIFSLRLAADLEIDRHDPANIRVEASWRMLASGLSEAGLLLRQKDIPFLVVCLPCGLQIDKPWTAAQYQRRLEKTCEGLSIPFLDMLPILASEGNIKTFYFPGDPIHLNAKGHRSVGKAVADFISSRFPQVD